MPTIQVFDPALCCATGVCGPAVDPALLRFAGALAWLRRQGVAVERRNLAQEPEAFAACAEVKRLLEERGEAALPVTLVDGRVVAVGAYPDKGTLAEATGIAIRTLPAAAAPEGGGPCC